MHNTCHEDTFSQHALRFSLRPDLCQCGLHVTVRHGLIPARLTVKKDPGQAISLWEAPWDWRSDVLMDAWREVTHNEFRSNTWGVLVTVGEAMWMVTHVCRRNVCSGSSSS